MAKITEATGAIDIEETAGPLGGGCYLRVIPGKLGEDDEYLELARLLHVFGQ